ncbi:MAG: hypothetical protein AB1806_08610 [Acidobacteriota bacterium]
MQRLASFVLVACLVTVAAVAQTRRTTPARKSASARKTEPAGLKCPSLLGIGLKTRLSFCDVPVGREPADGITVVIPPHRGATVLTFDLHNRLTYSEALVRERRAYARHTATIGVLTMDNTLLERAVIRSEFRVAADLYDRVAGGAGPSGLKAVAPAGIEPVRVALPADADAVVIMGEKLEVHRIDGVELFNGRGRPIAVISNARIEYQPGPARRKPPLPPS